MPATHLNLLGTKEFIALEDTYGAHNYHPLDVVIERAEGIWVYDVEGKRYLDCLAAYSAVKAARKWGYTKKGIPDGQAEIIVCEGNFHGRTISVVSFSTEQQYKQGFGPFTPGFRVIPFGDAQALRAAITP